MQRSIENTFSHSRQLAERTQCENVCTSAVEHYVNIKFYYKLEKLTAETHKMQLQAFVKEAVRMTQSFRVGQETIRMGHK